MEALAWLGSNWAMVWAMATTIGLVVMALLSKTYAKRDDMQRMEQRVIHIESKVDDLPTKTDLHSLALEMASLRGEISQLAPRLDGVQRLSDLLLENELQEKKSK
jgi:hypothetical protein